MLVCNVSFRAARLGIAADIAEATTAVDAIATGNVVFATLVDDPASVGDFVDAYSGEIMLEAASADSDFRAGLIYVAAIAEAATASDLPDGSTAAASAVTTTSIGGPLFMLNTTFPSSSLTVINAGR